MNLTPLVDFKCLFETAPGMFLVLAPDLTIVAASNAYLEATQTERKAIIGRSILNVLPGSNGDLDGGGVVSLKASLDYVLQHGKSHEMAIQRYSVGNTDGLSIEKYWAPKNAPVFNEQGELMYIMYHAVDETNNHQTLAKLEKTEFDYQRLVNNVNDCAIFNIDLFNNVASWNIGAENVKGYTAAEIVGKSVEVFYTPEDIAKGIPQHNLQMAIQYGYFESEGWRVKKNGDLFYANTIVTALRDEDGRLYGYSKITRDTTERKIAQQQLELLSQQVNQSNAAIFTTDADRRINSWNMGAQHIYGFTKEEVVGKIATVVLRTGITEENIVNALEKVAVQNYWSGELQRKTKTGKDIHVSSSVTAIKDNEDTITGYVEVSFDITEQKKLREQVDHLASIVDQSSDAIISRGIDKRFISWNKGAEALFGFTKEEAIGKTPLELGITTLSEKGILEIEQVILEKGKWKSERDFFHKDGSTFFGAVAANTLRNDQGEITSMVFIIKDISVRKQLEIQLKTLNEELEEKVKVRTAAIVENEKRFRALIENSNDIISLLDESGRVFYRSPSTARITGWTDEDMLGIKATVHVHPDDQARAKEILQEAMANPGTTVNCLLRSQHKKGHYLWLEGVVSNLIHDEYAQAVVFNFRDVTERVEANEKLKASENLFRALIENNNDIMTLMDASFKLLYRSPAATRVLGWTNQDMIGIEATKNIHPEDKAAATALVKEVMANPGCIYSTRFRMQHKLGHYVWLEGTLANLIQEAYIKAVVFNFRDITERIEAEEKLTLSERHFRSTLDNMLEGIQIHDFNWKYIYVNDALVRFSKYPKDALIGNTLMEKYPGIENTPLFATLSRCMTDRVAAHLETEFVFPDGSKADFELSIQPVPEGLFILSIDITERKRIQEHLTERDEQLRLFIEHSPVSLAMFDSSMNYISVSNRWAGDYNLQGYQLLGKNHYKIFPEITQQWKDIHRYCLAGNIKKSDNDSFVRANGTTMWLRWEIRPWHKASGEVGGIIIFSEDITEKKRAEQQREFDSNNLKALINNTNDLMWSVDRNYKLITSNQAFDDTVGKMTGTPVVKGSNTLFMEFSEALRKRYKSYYDRALTGEVFTEVEHYGLVKNFWAEVSFHPIHESGALVGTACFSRDITDRKQAEHALKKSFEEKQALAKRLSIILNTLPATIALLDSNGYIVDVNDSWRHFADHNVFMGSNYCIGSNYLNLLDNLDGEDNLEGKRVGQGIKAVLNNQVHEFVNEYTIHASKIKRWFRMVVTPLQGKEYTGAVIMHLDISEIRRLEQERLKGKMEEQKKIAKAILIGQEKERNFIGQELHDNINQILAGTKLYLGMAGNENEEVSKLIKYPMELIDTSIEEIRSLCHRLVTPVNDVDLKDLLSELLYRLKQNTKMAISFEYAVTDGILSDDLKLTVYRIIQELVNNILKYAAAVNVTVSIKTSERFIELTVKDDGKGFDLKKKRKGIGISNINNRVKSFDGDIKIKSAVGKGCTTSIKLPY